MSYVLPALQVHQEFEAIAEGTTDLLYACIVAPQYGLHRYSEEDEKEELGDYDPLITNEFTSYPGKSAGSSIDVNYNKLFFEDAVLEYYSANIDGSVGADQGLLTDGGNKFRNPNLVYKTANGVARSGVFGSRDIQIGDPIKVSVGVTEFETVVAGLIADIEAATVQGTPTLLGAPDSQAPAPNFSWDPGTITTPGGFDIDEAGSSFYDAMGSGVINETYEVEILELSGNPVSGHRVKITSASGTDDVVEDTLALTAWQVGTRGLVVDFTAGGVVFSVGDKFTITYETTYAQPTPTALGTYTGSKDTQYIVSVVTGGTIGEVSDANPVLQIYTTNGADASNPVTVTALGDIAIGNYGVVLRLEAGDEQMIKGSAFTIDVTAEGAGAVRTIAVADRLTGLTTNDELQIDYRLKSDFELADDKWTSDASSITIYPGATHINTLLGIEDTMEIISGTMFINYRELLTTFGNVLSSVLTLDEASAVCGPAVTDNPLGLMVNKALTNSGGIEVYFISPDEDSDTGYIDAIDALTKDTEPYSIVPYSNSLAVRDAVQAHCLNMSTPAVGQWRIYWISAETPRVSAVYTELAGGGDIVATITDDLLTADSALFVTNGVKAGDTVRINYGNETYDEYTVDQDPTVEDELQLLNAPDIGPAAIKMEVWREATKPEYADMISEIATHSNNRRGYAVWSEGLYDGLNPDGMPVSVMCAALAGLRSGVAPHQPLTNVAVTGFSMQREVNFRASELNEMAGNGVWLVVQTLAGAIYTRHQVSTDNDDINMREQTITTNLDSISKSFKSSMSSYYGRGNVSPGMLDLIEHTALQTITSIQSRPYPDTIGPQILDAVITKLEVNPVRRDAIDLVIRPVLPYPLNNLDVYFIIS